MIFKGKNILLISIQFFNYENLIKKQLENLGANVDLIDERPSNTFFTKAILRVKKEMYGIRINEYFREVIEKIKNTRYDYFLLIKGEATPKFFIEFLKANNPNIELIFYTYDSFKNNSNGLSILKYFDHKFTFDSNDALKYELRFRPLFFAQDYDELNNIHEQFDYDLAFIGTAHSDRYIISEKAKNWCENLFLKMFTFYFSPSKILFKFKKLTEKDFKNFEYNKISFNSLSHSDIIRIYKKTKVILDINHRGQNGLTMRTFETLGAGRKLITTNPMIKRYPFYDPQNILVVERENLHFEERIFMTEFNKIDNRLRQSMALEGWVKEVFGFEDTAHWDTVLNEK